MTLEGRDAAIDDQPATSPQPSLRSHFRLALGLYLVVLCVYGLTIGGHTSSSDEEGVLTQARAFASGTWTLDIDESNVGVTARELLEDGRSVGGGNVGPSVAVLPLLGLGSLVAKMAREDHRLVVENLVALFTNSFVAAGTTVAVFFLAMRLGSPRRRAALLSLVFAFGTYAWPHARTLFTEPLAALLVIGAVLGVVSGSEDDDWRRSALAGLCVGLALNARTTTAIFVPSIGMYLGLRAWRIGRLSTFLRHGVAFGVPVLLGLAALVVSNALRFGAAGDLGPESIPFTYPLGRGLVNLYFSTGKGLIFYAPVIVVAVFAIPLGLRRRPAETTLLLAVIASNSLLFAKFIAWHGDQSWGPRYQQIILPCVVALLAPALAGSLRWVRGAAVAGVVGVVPALLGILVYPAVYFQVGAAEPQFVGKPPVDADVAYLHAFHVTPSWSPLVGHARLVPDVVRNTMARINGRPAEVPPLPERTADRYFWWDFLVQVDVWWTWLPSAELPRWLLLALPVLGVGALLGAALLYDELFRRRDGGRNEVPEINS